MIGTYRGTEVCVFSGTNGIHPYRGYGESGRDRGVGVGPR